MEGGARRLCYLHPGGKEKSAKGDFSGVSGLIRALAVAEIDGVATSDFRPLGVWNKKLGLPEESLEEDVKLFWRRFEKRLMLDELFLGY